MAGQQEGATNRDDRGSLAAVVLHPVRLRILQAMAGREMTTSQLRERLPDVTPATLYRHVTALLDAEVLTVVAERKVRGAVERTMAIGPRDAHIGQDQAEQFSPDQVRQAFAAFIGAVTGQVDEHLGSDADDLWHGFGFGATVLHVDDADLDELQRQIAAVVARYQQPAPGKSPAMFGTVMVPSGPAEPGSGPRA